MSKVFIVIVTYNGIQWIKKCLKSCRGYEVIVVDNCSNDGTIELIQKEFPMVNLIVQNRNYGFGGANNIGISYALKNNADFVFLLNQDAHLKFTALGDLICKMESNCDYGILSPIHLDSTGNQLDRNFSLFVRQSDELIFDALCRKSQQPIYSVTFVNAAAWLLSRKTIETVGGFDPIFFHYGEDDNYCQRVLYHGLKIGIVTNTFICHDRELRFNKEFTFDEYLKRQERAFKVKWGNINTDYKETVLKQINKTKKSIIKSLIRFHFKTFRQFVFELKLIYEVNNVIKRSRKINKTKGLHYIA